MSRGVVVELVDATPDVLIRTLESLTHQLANTSNPPAKDRIRAERRLVEAEMTRRMEVGPKVVDLWNRLNGWIPGAAYPELAEVLGVETDLLKHYDVAARRHHHPEGTPS